MPRPRSLADADLAAAALAVIDRDGLAALSMRTVASELGMGTMSIYRYVTDREQLEALVVDQVLGAVDLSPSKHDSWQKRLASLVERVREAVSAHPAVVPLLLIHRHRSRASLLWAEAVLGVLHEAGFDVPQRIIALRGLISYVVGALQVEYLGPLSGAGTAAMAALSATEYPLLSETARHARRLPVDEEFRRGLDIVLDGLEDLHGSRGRTPLRDPDA